MSIRQFMAEYRDATEALWSEDERIWRRRAAFVLHAHPMLRYVLLSRIQSLHPGKGYGSAALDWLCALADKHQVRLCGIIEPFVPNPPLDTRQLADWYKRHGFTIGKGFYIERIPLTMSNLTGIISQ